MKFQMAQRLIPGKTTERALGQHLDVALWEGTPQKGLCERCRRNAAGACCGVETQRSRNLEASSLGRCCEGPGINFTWTTSNIVYDIAYDIVYDMCIQYRIRHNMYIRYRIRYLFNSKELASKYYFGSPVRIDDNRFLGPGSGHVPVDLYRGGP